MSSGRAYEQVLVRLWGTCELLDRRGALGRLGALVPHETKSDGARPDSKI